MSEHRAKVTWRRETADSDSQAYKRDHVWSFNEAVEVNASAAADYGGTADFVDPEQAYVAALSSCHMLTFLALASKRGFTVEAYADEAVGRLGKNADGRMAVTHVDLRPTVTFAPDAAPDQAALASLHEKAHKYCFIANSVLTEVNVIT